MRNYAKYIAALLLFGFNGIVASRIDLTSMQITLVRTLLGSLLMATAVFASRALRNRSCRRKTPDRKADTNQKSPMRSSLPAPSPRDVAFVAASGACMGVSWMFQYEAFRHIGVGLTSLIYCAGPLLLVAVSPILFGEPFRRRKAIGFTVALAGILLVNSRIGTVNVDAFGVLCAFACAVAYAGMIALNKQSRALSGVSNSTIQLVSAFVMCAISCAASGEIPLDIPTSSIAPALLLGIVNTGFGCYLYFSSIGALPAQSVAVCDYLEPLSAIVLAAIFLGEALAPVQIAGGALIVCGALVSELGIATSTPSR